MLREAFPPEILKKSLLPHGEFHPYPAASERRAWEAVSAETREGLIARAESSLHFQWPALPASLQMRYARDGDRVTYEKLHFARRCALNDLVFGECAEASGRFMDDIVDGIWAICEESSWCIPAHEKWQRGGGLPDTTDPVVDLFAAETAGQLAWVSYLLKDELDSVSVLIGPRIEREIRFRMLEPCLERDDFFFMGLSDRPRRVNNWNPWVSSNWLAAALLIERDVERRTSTVEKILRVLDKFLDPYPRDGGCDEGPSYWNRAAASLFDCLELLSLATGGKLELFGDDLVKAMGSFIHRAHIADDYFVNFADGGAMSRPNAELVRAYGRRTGDVQLESFGEWLGGRQRPKAAKRGENSGPGGLRVLRTVFADPPSGERKPAPVLARDVWLKDLEVMVARDREGSPEGLFVAAKGGNNNESHNHNDVGSFIVYVDGRPVIVDPGVEIYSRKTFSGERYEIWTMQSAYHTLLPVVGGVQQKPGPEYRARDVVWRADDATAELTLDIAATYPPEAGLDSWARRIALERGERVLVTDSFVFGRAPDLVELNLLTPCEVELGDGFVLFHERPLDEERKSGRARMEYESGSLEASCQVIELDDIQLSRIWGGRLNRVTFAARNVAASGGWRFTVTRG